jgi:hypothetical protein
MAVTEPSQNLISNGLAILILRHAWRKTFGPNSSGSLAMFTAILRASLRQAALTVGLISR